MADKKPASRPRMVRCKPVDEARLKRIMDATGITEVSEVFREAVRRWDEELERKEDRR